MTKECEFGCDCDTPTSFKDFSPVLKPVDLDQLIAEKLVRARIYLELQEKIGGQFETD